MNDQEWNDEKQKELDKILYRCFMDGYMSAADIDTECESDLTDYHKGLLKRGKLMANAYVSMKKGLTDDDIIENLKKEKKC